MGETRRDETGNDVAVIPRIIHQVWIGGGPMTDAAERFHATWKTHHPNWDIILWTKEKVESELFPLHNQEAYEAETNHGYRADILRLELLLRFGGVYADMDMECLKPMDPLLGLPAFLGRGKYCLYEIGEQFIETSLMGSVPGHAFLEQVVRHLTTWAALFDGYSVSIRTGPQWVQRELYAYWKRQDRQPLAILPRECFYPWWAAEPEGTGVTPDTFAAHHWWASWNRPYWKQGGLASLCDADCRGRFFQFVDALPDAERAAHIDVLVDAALADTYSENAFYQIAGCDTLRLALTRWPERRRGDTQRLYGGLFRLHDHGNVSVRSAALHALTRLETDATTAAWHELGKKCCLDS